MNPAQAKPSEKVVRKYLRELVGACEQSLAALDAEMKNPSTNARGKRIAAIANFLELHKDRAKLFGLGEKLKKPRK